MRLILGDCIDEMHKLIEEGIRFNAIICDPPYGIHNNKFDTKIPFGQSLHPKGWSLSKGD